MSEFDSDAASWRDSESGSDPASSSSESDDDGAHGASATVPFFGPPPRGFKLQISQFGELFRAVGGWVSVETVGLLRGGYAPEDADEVVGPSADGVDGAAVRGVVDQMVFQVLGEVLGQLQVDISAVEAGRWVGRVIRSFAVRGPAPGFSRNQWRLTAAAILACLARHYLPGVEPAVAVGGDRRLLCKFLLASGSCLEEFDCLVPLLAGDEGNPKNLG